LLVPYIFHLLKVYYHLTRLKTYTAVQNPGIFVSVVVACRNEEKYLHGLLESLASQDYDSDLLEVILVDDNSSDSTWQIAAGFKGIMQFKMIKNPFTGKKSAIRQGINASSGELIVTTDADCRPERNWIKTVASFYSEKKPEMIICPVEMRGSRGFFQRFQELEFLSLQGVTAGTAASGNPVMCNGASLAFTRNTYERHSANLHPSLVSGDDVFLLHSLKKEKASRIEWLESHEAAVITETCSSLSSFLGQRARWLSKAGAYTDRYTVTLAIVTSVTILIQPILLVAGIFNHVYLLIFLAALLVKSVPDYLVLNNTTSRYGRRDLMKWFLPSQLFYPFYVLGIIPSAIMKGKKWN
jgi:cellulose synthase/poly-beta-1,6-N-acetylglucosamine synthase-like glycosyltransferase